MSAKRFASIWNAASSPTALPAPAVMTAGTTTSWRILAKAVASAPRATRGAWWRRRHTSPTTSFPVCRCATVPKRLRYFMQRDGAVLNMVLRIFLRVIAQSLQSHSPGAKTVDKATLHIGAVALAKPQVHIHRFGSSLNGHVHFHVCVVDGVFGEVPSEGDADAAPQSSPPGIVFHPATGIDADAVAQVKATLRRRILRAFVGQGLLESCDTKEMLAYQHSGFSVDAGVCIQSHDRAALERLLRYCARPSQSRCHPSAHLHITCGQC